jgi:RecA/RadA recombinase
MAKEKTEAKKQESPIKTGISVKLAMDRLKKIEGAITERFDPWAVSNLIQSRSPSLNWLYGHNHGIPRGYSTLLWGESKSGKSLISYDITGNIHQTDPEAIVVKFDTEMRDEGQMTPEMAKAFGIDLNRYLVISKNSPTLFDDINTNILELCQSGAKIPLIIVDSITGIKGRRESDQETVMQHQIGDHAVTLQVGLKAILETIRRQRIHLIMTAHARDELDAIEVKRGNKKKVAAANAVKHVAEFFVNVFRVNNKEGKADALGNAFTDESRKDMNGDGESTGHKIGVWMQGNTMGPENRMGTFTLDKTRGIINQHEELFELGTGWGVIAKPTTMSYKIGSEAFVGRPACLQALASRKDLQDYVIQGMIQREKAGVPDIKLEDALKIIEGEPVE